MITSPEAACLWACAANQEFYGKYWSQHVGLVKRGLQPASNACQAASSA